MKSKALLNLVLLTAFASAAEPEKLLKLRSSYESAVTKATAPIQRTYLQELEKLKVEFTKAGKLEDALAIDTEIKKLTEGQATQSGEASDAKLPSTKSGLEKLLSDTTWSVVREQDQKPWGDVTFHSTGKFTGFNKSDMEWKASGKGKVLVGAYEFEFTKDMSQFTVTWGATGKLTGKMNPK
jgi:hypothetical protein